MLCSSALKAFHLFNSTADGKPRAFLINYDTLPGSVPQVLLPLFGESAPSIPWLEKMATESKYYSKSRGNTWRVFTGDSKDKEERASDEIQKSAAVFLQSSYDELNSASLQALKRIAPSLHESVLTGDGVEAAAPGAVNWKALSAIPYSMAAADSEEADTGSDSSIKHSRLLKKKNFLSWIPFANHHSSEPMQVRSTCLHHLSIYLSIYLSMYLCIYLYKIYLPIMHTCICTLLLCICMLHVSATSYNGWMIC